jgi:hypothetical protein
MKLMTIKQMLRQLEWERAALKVTTRQPGDVPGCQPSPEDPTWCEENGLHTSSIAQQYCHAITNHLDSRESDESGNYIIHEGRRHHPKWIPESEMFARMSMRNVIGLVPRRPKRAGLSTWHIKYDGRKE